MRKTLELSVMSLSRRALVAMTIGSISGCALFARPSVWDAARVAQRSVCGREPVRGDTTCRVERVDFVRAGYRFIVRRLPPAGDDRLAVLVQGRSVYATRLDSTVFLRLRVLDSASGKPRADAGVQVLPHRPMRRTDVNGRAVVRDADRYVSLIITCPTWRQPFGPTIRKQELTIFLANDTNVVLRVPTASCLESKPSSGPK